MTCDALIKRMRSSSLRLAAAERLCQRAALADRLDWPAAQAGGESDLTRQVEPLDRLINAHFASPGWSSMIARLFFDVQEALDASNDPIACWRWTDIKSKFCSLRAYGNLAPRRDSALARCLKALRAEGVPFARGETVTGEPLEALRARLAPFSLHIPESAWSEREPLQATPDGSFDEQAEQAAFEYPPSSTPSLDQAREEASLLASAAESVSALLCEGCGAPGPAARHRGWGVAACEACSNARSSGWNSSFTPLIAPKAMLALAALQLISHQSARDQQALNPLAHESDPESAPDALRRADELAPLAALALSGLDVNLDLGGGWRMAHYAWPAETLSWLDLAGADWYLPNDQGATPQQAQAVASPAWWAERERRALELCAPAPCAIAAPRASL